MNVLRRVYLYLRYNAFVTFIVGLVAAFATDRLLSNMIDRGGDVWPLLGIALLVVVVAALLYRLLVEFLRRWDAKNRVPMGDRPFPHRGLIMVLGGKSGVTGPIALDHHESALEHIWFVVTDMTKGIADSLERRAPAALSHRVEIQHHYRPEEAYSAIRRAASHARAMGLSLDDLMCDVTGGTSAMTAGAIQACLELRIAAEMVAAKYHEESGEVERPHEVIELKMTDSALKEHNKILDVS